MTARRVLLTTWFASAAAFVPSTRLAGVGQRRCATALHPAGRAAFHLAGTAPHPARRARPLGAQASDADEDFFSIVLPDKRKWLFQVPTKKDLERWTYAITAQHDA